MSARKKEPPAVPTKVPTIATIHPLADIFPLMEGEPFAGLVEDIRKNGLREAITEYEGAILDGRNRYNACLVAGVAPRFVALKGRDPLGYVISTNLHRRHMTESQRSMVAAKLANMPLGGALYRSAPLQSDPPRVSQGDAATLMSVSVRSVNDAVKVRAHGAPELIARVEGGVIPVSLAAKLVVLPIEQQRFLADEPPAKLVSAIKHHSRADREKKLATATVRASQTFGGKLYGVICADPPWRFAPWSGAGMDRAADNHYPTMTLDEICELTPPGAADCVLFLWATAPMLLEALDVIEAWGFDYKSHFVWLKDRIGTGYWSRNRHELLLVATRGKVPAPAPGQQYESVIEAAVGAHSEKPGHFYEMIEELFPSAALLEMFARRQRAGWDAWGNEVPAVGDPVE